MNMRKRNWGFRSKTENTADEALSQPDEEKEEDPAEVEAHLAENLISIRRGDIITGTVVQINENEVLLILRKIEVLFP